MINKGKVASDSGGNKLKEKMKNTIEGYKKLNEKDKHCIHIYYGFGKGKTTSTIGLAIRALGAGKKVAIVQFDKGFDGKNEHYSERSVLRKLKEIGYPIDLYPTGCERMNDDGTFRFKNTNEDIDEAKRALGISRKLIISGKLDLLILDECIAAAAYNLIKKENVVELVDLFIANKNFELVLTGHIIWKELEDKADLITEMRKVMHYFDKGIPARPGIEY